MREPHLATTPILRECDTRWLFCLAAMLWQFLRTADDGRLAFALPQIPVVECAAMFVGALSLEIYLFPGFVHFAHFVRELRFPFTVVVFLSLTFLVGRLVAWLVKRFRRVAARFLPGCAVAD